MVCIHVNTQLLEESWVERSFFDKIHNLNCLIPNLPNWSWKSFWGQNLTMEHTINAFHFWCSLFEIQILSQYNWCSICTAPRDIIWQNIFWFKKDEIFFSIISEALVVISREQNSNSSLNEPEWTYLANTSNWEHNATSRCWMLQTWFPVLLDPWCQWPYCWSSFEQYYLIMKLLQVLSPTHFPKQFPLFGESMVWSKFPQLFYFPAFLFPVLWHKFH